jgi:hypothetical protein
MDFAPRSLNGVQLTVHQLDSGWSDLRRKPRIDWVFLEKAERD